MIPNAPRVFIASFPDETVVVEPTKSIAHRVSLTIGGRLTILNVTEAKQLSRALVECANEVAPPEQRRKR